MSSSVGKTCNIAHRLTKSARDFPYKRALVFPESRDEAGQVAYTHLTFQQLDALASRYAWGLSEAGIKRGTRTLLMVRMSLDFTALAFALFKIGAVPVMIDPGMGVRGFLNCVKQVSPEALIGIPKAHILRLLCRRAFRSVKIPVTLGPRWFWGGVEVADLKGEGAGAPYATTDMSENELAAILFTSGSTGPAKGVEYTHRIFETQVDLLRDEFGITPDNIDLPCFPLFGLFSTGLGCTSVIPDMDPTRPANVDPKRVIEAVEDHGVTYSFGSPALWRTVGRYCATNGVRLPSLQRIYMAGAPVPPDLHRLLLDNVLADGANIFTPYGATESLPVSCFNGRDVLAETAEASAAGAGICVGTPVHCAQVEIIPVSDEAIGKWQEVTTLPAGKIGEIVVKGPMVTPAYYGRAEQTRLAKIYEGDVIWHRIGDLGYFDPKGRLWMCGRKSHRVETEQGMMCTVCCEAIFNNHPQVARSALVGIGGDEHFRTPVMVIEMENGKQPRTKAEKECLRKELLEIAANTELTASISNILFYESFPVDVRHNAKINREKLRKFAQTASMSTN